MRNKQSNAIMACMFFLVIIYIFKNQSYINSHKIVALILRFNVYSLINVSNLKIGGFKNVSKKTQQLSADVSQ